MNVGKCGEWYYYEGPEPELNGNDSTDDLSKWCDKHFGKENWDVDPIRWYFKSEEDRLLFILRWVK